jgi:hypothetical protein
LVAFLAPATYPPYPLPPASVALARMAAKVLAPASFSISSMNPFRNGSVMAIDYRVFWRMFRGYPVI